MRTPCRTPLVPEDKVAEWREVWMPSPPASTPRSLTDGSDENG